MTGALAILLGLFQAEAKDEAIGAAKKMVELKNYGWKGSMKFDGNLPFGGNNEIPEAKFEGSHDADKGTHMLTDSTEYLKVGEKTVSRPRGEWRLEEERDGGGGFGGRGGRGGMGRMFGMFGGAPKMPHEELKDPDGKISDVKKEDAKEKVGEVECAVYSCTLREDAARDMAPFARMLERIPDSTVSGSLKLWVDESGQVLKYETTTKVAASFQGNDFEVSVIRSTELKDVGKAKVEIPDDAKKVLETKKSD
jgi:hypothetical protein